MWCGEAGLQPAPAPAALEAAAPTSSTHITPAASSSKACRALSTPHRRLHRKRATSHLSPVSERGGRWDGRGCEGAAGADLHRHPREADGGRCAAVGCISQHQDHAPRSGTAATWSRERACVSAAMRAAWSWGRPRPTAAAASAAAGRGGAGELAAGCRPARRGRWPQGLPDRPRGGPGGAPRAPRRRALARLASAGLTWRPELLNRPATPVKRQAAMPRPARPSWLRGLRQRKHDGVGTSLPRRLCRALDGWGLQGPRKDEQLRPAGRAVLLVSRLLHAHRAQRRLQARPQIIQFLKQAQLRPSGDSHPLKYGRGAAAYPKPPKASMNC